MPGARGGRKSRRETHPAAQTGSDNMIAKKYAGYMHALVKNVVGKIGPREPCSKQEKAAGLLIAAEWKPICDRVDIEEFTCSPTAFLGFLPFSVLFYIAAAAFYWFFPPAALPCALIGFSMLYFEFMRYKEFIDFLWPKRKGENVIGVIAPKGLVKRRVIVAGHLDSAYEFNLWYFFKNFALPIMIIGVLAALLLVGASAARTVAYFIGGADARVYTILGIAVIALYPFLGMFLLFHSYNPVPGAMDNMAGVAVVAGLGKYLADAKKSGGFFPENTEVILLAAAAEEAGLRGARRFVKKHLDEFKKIPTHALVLDGICDETFLTIVSSEICTAARHDRKLVNMALEIAKKHNWPIRKRFIPFGASDASAFSNAGISSTCILCMNVDKLMPNYHTRLDTPEKVRPEALAVSLQMVIDMLERIDKTG